MDAFLAALALASTPIILAGLGGVFTYRAGVLNVAIEGMMLVGAFAAIVAGAAAGSVWIGLLASIGAAFVFGLLFGLGCLVLRADVFVVGIGSNLIALGLTSFLLVRLLDRRGSYTPDDFPPLPTIHLGPLADVPILGPLLDGQSVIVYLTILLVIGSHVFLRRMRLGLHMSVAGEAEEALEAVGVSPTRMRWLSIAFCCVLCGLAGAQLSMAVLGSFSNDMTAGRGYIALAAVFFAAGQPFGTAVAACLFGASEALSNRLQIDGFPPELILMLPYALTILVLTVNRMFIMSRAGRWQWRWPRTAPRAVATEPPR